MDRKTAMTFIALPCQDLKKSVELYQNALGIEFKEETHNGGPVHFAAELENNVVLELYDETNLKRTVMGFDVPWQDNVRRLDEMGRELRIKGRQ